MDIDWISNKVLCRPIWKSQAPGYSQDGQQYTYLGNSRGSAMKWWWITRNEPVGCSHIQHRLMLIWRQKTSPKTIGQKKIMINTWNAPPEGVPNFSWNTTFMSSPINSYLTCHQDSRVISCSKAMVCTLHEYIVFDIEICKKKKVTRL